VAALAAIIKELEGTGGRRAARIGVGDGSNERTELDGEMPSRNEVLGFAARTRENLDCIERAFMDKGSGHVVTQLVSSLLGLIVFPHEKKLRCIAEGNPARPACRRGGMAAVGNPQGKVRDAGQPGAQAEECRGARPHAVLVRQPAHGRRDHRGRGLASARERAALARSGRCVGSAQVLPSIHRSDRGDSGIALRLGTPSEHQQVKERRKPAATASSSEQNQRSGLVVRR
jgi:hypothetical protein